MDIQQLRFLAHVSDRSSKTDLTFSTRFVLDSPVSRRQHAEAKQLSATIP
jgi:hypothetical protein